MGPHLNIFRLSVVSLAIFISGQAISDTDVPEEIVSEFTASCIADKTATAATPDLDKARIWIQVNSDIDESLNTYYGTISGLLGDTITHASHFTKWVDNRQIFLTRYSYGGNFGITSHICMISDFARDDWEFPSGFAQLIDGKVVESEFSTVTVEDRKTVGEWRTVEDLQPISKITASAFLKDGLDHQASGFYGVQLTAIITEIEETQDNLN